MSRRFFILMLCLSQAVYAQTEDHTPTPEDFHITQFTTADGLPSNRVYAILEDSQGFLWFGTEIGLVRYDGYSFEMFCVGTGENERPGPRRVNTIIEDTAGDLWVGTYGDGLYRCDRETGHFTAYRYDVEAPNGLRRGVILSLYESPKEPGVIWIGTQSMLDEGLINKLDVSTSKISHVPLPTLTTDTFLTTVDYLHSVFLPYSAILEDHAVSLWIGGWGLNRYDRESGLFTHFLPEPDDPESPANIVTSIHEDKNDVLWVGTIKGLYRSDPSADDWRSFLPNPHRTVREMNLVRSIYEDAQGVLWISSSSSALLNFNPLNERITTFLSGNSKTRVIYGDITGGLWVGSFGKGIYKLNRLQLPITYYRHDPEGAKGLGMIDVRGIYEDRYGIVWIGGSQGQLDRLDRETGEITHFQVAERSGQQTVNVNGIYEDNAGELWVAAIGTGYGLGRFDRKRETISYYRPNSVQGFDITTSCVNPLLEDRAGNLWIPSPCKGLYHVNRATRRVTFFIAIQMILKTWGYTIPSEFMKTRMVFCGWQEILG